MVPNIDVYSFSLHTERLADHTKHLSPRERARARDTEHPRVRRDFIVSRSRLRSILGRHLKTAPSNVPIRVDPHGKPILASSELAISLSHAGTRGVIAVTNLPTIGIDLEHRQPIPDLLEVARPHFSPGENEALAQLAPDKRQGAFYRAWCSKEALTKALGSGLAFGLDRVIVEIEPQQSPRVRAIEHHAHDASRWALTSLAVMEEYECILASPRTCPAPRIHTHHLAPC